MVKITVRDRAANRYKIENEKKNPSDSGDYPPPCVGHFIGSFTFVKRWDMLPRSIQYCLMHNWRPAAGSHMAHTAMPRM